MIQRGSHHPIPTTICVYSLLFFFLSLSTKLEIAPLVLHLQFKKKLHLEDMISITKKLPVCLIYPHLFIYLNFLLFIQYQMLFLDTFSISHWCLTSSRNSSPRKSPQQNLHFYLSKHSHHGCSSPHPLLPSLPNTYPFTLWFHSMNSLPLLLILATSFICIEIFTNSSLFILLV